MEKDSTFTSLLVTPEMAASWLSANNYPYQRKVSPTHVVYLRELMRSGHFLAHTRITFAVYNKQHFLVNGQHTLHAIVASSIPIMLQIEDRPVASMDAMATLYAAFDRNRTRSFTDVYHAHDLANRYHLTVQQVNVLSATLPFILSGFHSPSVYPETTLYAQLRNPEWREMAMDDWAPVAHVYFNAFLGGGPGNPGPGKTNVNIGLRAAVAAVGILTARYQPGHASKFWHRIAMDDGLRAGTAPHTLLRYLYTNKPHAHSGWVYGRYIASAWNAFFNERSLHRLHARPVEEPITIAGTPHTSATVMQYVTKDHALTWEAVPLD